MALQGFDKDYYLQAKLDALVASGETEWVGKDADFLEAVLGNVYGLTPEDHYSQYGYAEGLAPNAYFNAAEYTLAKAIQLFNSGFYMSVEDALADYEAKWPGDDYQHYLQYGSAEGINPSNAFDESSYLDSKLAALQADPDTSVEWADKTVDDVQAAFIAAGLTVLGHYIAYGKDEGIAVTPVPADEQVDASDIGVVGETFTLTTGVDTLTGTSGDDFFIALDEDDITDTLTLGDDIDGGAGTDTLKIFSDNDNLTLAALQVSNVENLLVINAHEDWDNFDVASRDFDKITLDEGGLESGGLEVDNVNASTAVTMTNILADGETNCIYFNNDNNSTVGTTTVTISDVDMSEDYMYFDVEAEFTAADTVNTTVNLSDIDDQEYGDYGEYYHYLDTGDTMGVAVNTTVNVENVVNADYFGVYFYVDQAGDSVNNFTVNLTNTDNVYVWMNIDNDGNGTSAEDVLTYNLDAVTSSNDEAYLSSDDFETININVASDSTIYKLSNDDVDGNNQTINIVANADFTVEYELDFSNDNGDVTINVSGSGNVDLGEVEAGDGDADDTVTVAASALTGDFTMTDDYGYINTIESGTGDDDITVGAYTTVVDTGAGDDKVDMNGYDYGHADAETLDGGADTDTIVINDGALLDADTAANISNFEILDVTDGTGTYDMDVETSLTNVQTTDNTGAVTIDNAAAGATYTAKSMTANIGVGPLTWVLKDATGINDALDVILAANDADTDQSVEGNIALALSADGIETINVASTVVTASEESAPGADDALTTADYMNSIFLDADAMKTLNITGNAITEVVFTSATTALTQINATANTGGVMVDLSDSYTMTPGGPVPDAAGSFTTGSVTFNGSAEADTFKATDNGDLVQGNGGADNITLGAGDDTVRYASVSDSQLTLTDTDDPADGIADVMSGFDVITGFDAIIGTDLIELSSLLGLATGDARADMLQLGAIGGTDAAAMETFIGDGVDFFDTGLVDRATAFADDGTDGYLFIDANSDGDFTQADDMVIQLDGVTTLAITDITFG